MRLLLLFPAAVLCLAGCEPTPPQPKTPTPIDVEKAAPLPRGDIEEIEKAITSAMAEQGIPGLSMAIVTDNQLRYAAGYGLADLENNIPAKASTVYRWASVSK